MASGGGEEDDDDFELLKSDVVFTPNRVHMTIKASPGSPLHSKEGTKETSKPPQSRAQPHSQPLSSLTSNAQTTTKTVPQKRTRTGDDSSTAPALRRPNKHKWIEVKPAAQKKAQKEGASLPPPAKVSLVANHDKANQDRSHERENNNGHASHGHRTEDVASTNGHHHGPEGVRKSLSVDPKSGGGGGGSGISGSKVLERVMERPQSTPRDTGVLDPVKQQPRNLRSTSAAAEAEKTRPTTSLKAPPVNATPLDKSHSGGEGSQKSRDQSESIAPSPTIAREHELMAEGVEISLPPGKRLFLIPQKAEDVIMEVRLLRPSIKTGTGWSLRKGMPDFSKHRPSSDASAAGIEEFDCQQALIKSRPNPQRAYEKYGEHGEIQWIPLGLDVVDETGQQFTMERAVGSTTTLHHADTQAASQPAISTPDDFEDIDDAVEDLQTSFGLTRSTKVRLIQTPATFAPPEPYKHPTWQNGRSVVKQEGGHPFWTYVDLSHDDTGLEQYEEDLIHARWKTRKNPPHRHIEQGADTKAAVLAKGGAAKALKYPDGTTP